MTAIHRPGAPERSDTAKAPPFDVARLDELMARAEVDVVLATSWHNVQYLLGGYRFFMYAGLDAVGLSRYLPVLAYARGRIDAAFYVGAGNEDWDTDVRPVWVPEIRNAAWGSEHAGQLAAEALRARGHAAATVAVELPYLPADAFAALQSALPDARFVDASDLLEELRAVKRPDELDLLRRGATAVVDAMLATFGAVHPGDSKRQIAERLRQEQTTRGLRFAYCLIAAGADHNRAPSEQVLRPDEMLSLDSGAELGGYVADVARMAVAGEPTARAQDLLSQVDQVQQAARQTIAAGVRGGEIFERARAAMTDCPDAAHMSFLAHGTGLVTHEAPRLTATGSPPYPAAHAEQPLRAGMALSVETHVADPQVGFVKLEDTVIVTADGAEAVADHGRGWNAVGG
jgi:Xaa-Pro aminopeptidase